MEREIIFTALRTELCRLLPDLDAEKITEEDSMQNLGANSIDRFDIIINTMYRLALKKNPDLTDFSDCKNIADIVRVFLSHQ